LTKSIILVRKSAQKFRGLLFSARVEETIFENNKPQAGTCLRFLSHPQGHSLRVKVERCGLPIKTINKVTVG
jgi:hypothetical protein